MPFTLHGSVKTQEKHKKIVINSALTTHISRSLKRGKADKTSLKLCLKKKKTEKKKGQSGKGPLSTFFTF